MWAIYGQAFSGVVILMGGRDEFWWAGQFGGRRLGNGWSSVNGQGNFDGQHKKTDRFVPRYLGTYFVGRRY